MTIGQRAAEEIRKRAFPKSHTKEVEDLGIAQDCYRKWRQGRTNPDSWAMAKMAEAGYDILHILTGKPSGEPAYPVLCRNCGRKNGKPEDGVIYCGKLKRHMPENGYCCYGCRSE